MAPYKQQSLGPKIESKYKHRYNLDGDKIVEVKEVTVFAFRMGDVEDPDLWAAEPMYKWQESEMGRWVMTRAVESPVWHRIVDPETFGYRYVIRAKLTEKDLTFFYLKWRDLVDNHLR